MIVVIDFISQQTIRAFHPSEFVMLPGIGHRIIIPKYEHVLLVKSVYHRIGAHEMVVVTVNDGPVEQGRLSPVSW